MDISLYEENMIRYINESCRFLRCSSELSEIFPYI
jgi:hypothetical protein